MAVSPQRALLVPDASHWAAAGVDPADFGIAPVIAPSEADRVVVPAELPPGLADAVRERVLRAGGTRALSVLLDAKITPGKPSASLIEPASTQTPAKAAQDDPGHGDMMEVSGEPSADGLIMEPIEVEVGPLSPALPTGLVAKLTLDGDIVFEAAIHSVFDAGSDPLSRAATRWAAARASIELAPAEVARHLAATEVERALSHIAWLARFAHLLGWKDLAERCERAARQLIPAHRDLRAEGADPSLPSPGALDDVAAMLRESHRLALRTRGLASLTRETVDRQGIGGPSARAAGVRADARADDPAYQVLGFDVSTEADGDARARAVLRAKEACAGLRLARAALEAGELPIASDGAVEGPRGPLRANERSGGTSASGSRAAREAAAEAAVGLELASGLVAIASFDLSPWEAGP